MNDHLVRKVGRVVGSLLVSVGIVGCRPAVAVETATPTTGAIPTIAAPSLTTGPTLTTPAPSPTVPASSSVAASPASPMTPATLECEATQPWTQTQRGLILSLCFEPYPPRLGVLTAYQAVLIDATGQPVLDAAVELTIVGGMAGMEGEHDEDFSVTLASQGAGLYTAEGRVGPTDLVLTEVRIVIRHGGQLRAFSIPADDLPPP